MTYLIGAVLFMAGDWLYWHLDSRSQWARHNAD